MARERDYQSLLDRIAALRETITSRLSSDLIQNPQLADALVKQVDDLFAGAVEADSKFAATSTNAVVTITDSNTGARTDVAAGDSGFTVSVTTQGITATAPNAVYAVAASSNLVLTFPVQGIPFSNGITVSNSSTGPTKTAGSADCYYSAVIR